MHSSGATFPGRLTEAGRSGGGDQRPRAGSGPPCAGGGVSLDSGQNTGSPPTPPCIAGQDVRDFQPQGPICPWGALSAWECSDKRRKNLFLFPLTSSAWFDARDTWLDFRHLCCQDKKTFHLLKLPEPHGSQVVPTGGRKHRSKSAQRRPGKNGGGAAGLKVHLQRPYRRRADGTHILPDPKFYFGHRKTTQGSRQVSFS